VNRREYLRELENALRSARVVDADDVLGEYDQHFTMKLRDGYTEEEICARLISPGEIAAQLGGAGGGGEKSGPVSRILTAIGVFSLDFFLAVSPVPVFFSFLPSVAACAFAIVLYGPVLVLQSIVLIDVSWFSVPYMPLASAILVGTAFLALGLLCAVGTLYCVYLLLALARSYLRWYNNILLLRGTSRVLPPLPVFPLFGERKRRTLRAVALISLAVFVLTLVAGFVSLVVAADGLEFWRVWGWFV